jgi:hypothetical protein
MAGKLFARINCRTRTGSPLARRGAAGRSLRLRFSRLGTTFEIGRIPAVTFELKARRGKLLGKVFGVAFGAGRQQGIADFLHDVFLKAATGAAISVDRHGNLQKLISGGL